MDRNSAESLEKSLDELQAATLWASKEIKAWLDLDDQNERHDIDAEVFAKLESSLNDFRQVWVESKPQIMGR